MLTIELSDICMKCARCCKDFPYVELSESEVLLLQRLTGLSSSEFSEMKGNSDADGYFLQFQENGDCVFLRTGDWLCPKYHNLIK